VHLLSHGFTRFWSVICPSAFGPWEGEEILELLCYGQCEDERGWLAARAINHELFVTGELS
jgi:hypothetical protein